MTAFSIVSMSCDESAGSFAIGAMSPLARNIGGEPARKCRSDALLLISTRRRLSIFSSARPPLTAGCEAGAAGVGRLSTPGAAAGVGIAEDTGEELTVGVKPSGGTGDGSVFGDPARWASMRAEILPF